MRKSNEIAKYGLDLEESEKRDAYSEVWNDIKNNDGVWGGRAQGGIIR